MDFEEFLKKLDSDMNPDKAFKLYLQVELGLIRQILISTTGLTQESWDRIEDQVLNRVAEEMKKK